MTNIFLKFKSAAANLKRYGIAFFSRFFWRDKIVLGSLIGALFLNLVLTFLIFVEIPDSDLPLILHFHIYRGVDFLGEANKIYFLPLVALILTFINAAIADSFYKKERIISYLFILSSPVMVLFLLIAGLNLIFINR